MSCVKPTFINVRGEKVQVPCRHCMNCRIKRQSELSFLMNKEVLKAYKDGKGCSFVTLTYDDDNIPFIHLPTKNIYRGLYNMATSRNEQYFTLYKKDVQDFLKRVRRNLDYNKINLDFKTFYCGEFGSSTDRPHYHIIFIGLTDYLSKQLTRKCWPYGICDVGSLSAGGINYVSKYCVKSQSHDKRIKALYSHCHVQGPFIQHSCNISKDYVLKNIDLIAKNNLQFLSNGHNRLYPKYVQDIVKYRTGYNFEKELIDYFNNNQVKDWKLNGTFKSFENYDLEKSLLKEKHLIESARSKGLNVNPVFLEERHWLQPNHSFDRIPTKKEKWFEPYKALWFNELKNEGKTISEISKIFNNFSKNY